MAINIAVIMKKHEVLAKGKKEIMLLMTSTAFVVTVVMIVMGIPFCCYCCCSKKMMMVMVMVMTAAAAITFAMHYPSTLWPSPLHFSPSELTLASLKEFPSYLFLAFRNFTASFSQFQGEHVLVDCTPKSLYNLPNSPLGDYTKSDALAVVGVSPDSHV